MDIDVGRTLVYPHHGASEIIAIEERTMRGEVKRFMKLRVLTSDLIIMLPVDNAELVGLREVIDSEGVAAVHEVLLAEFVEEPGNWSRRNKANVEKLASGDILRISEVLRDLWRRNQDRDISASEKRMLQKSRQLLASEIALAQSVSEEEAAASLEDVLAGTQAVA